MFYPEIEKLKRQGLKVFMRPVLMDYGLIQSSLEHIIELNDELEQFHSYKKEAVFVFYIGALDHWMTLIAHKKSQEEDCDFWVCY